MSKKLKFIKDHVSGIGKGSVVKFESDHADRLVEEKYAEEMKADDKTAYGIKRSHVEDPGKEKRERKQKAALANQKKVKAKREANRSQ